jgi:PAS domain S-box-containing protein
MSGGGCAAVLTRIRDRLLWPASPGSAINEALGVAAAACPVVFLEWNRMRLDKGEPEFSARCGGAPSGLSATASGRELASWVRQRLGEENGGRRGSCRLFSCSSSSLSPSAATKADARVFVLTGHGSMLDALTAVYEPTHGEDEELEDFLCSLLSLVQLFADQTLGMIRCSGSPLQIERAKQEWEASVDALPQLVCLIDQHGVVVRANRALEAMGLGDVRTATGADFLALLKPLGIFDSAVLAMAEVLGASKQRPLPRADAAVPLALLWEHCGEVSRDGTLALSALKGAGGRVFDLRIERCRLPSEGSTPHRYNVAVVEDVTERHQARHLLENFNEQLRREVEGKTAALRRTNAELQREIEAHKRDKEALRLSEYRYHSFVEKTLIGIFLAEKGSITYCNKRFAQMLGYDEGDLIGKGVARILGDQYSMTATVKSDFSGSEQGQECLVSTRDGRRIWVHVTEAPYADSGRDIVIANVLDVTARRDFEDRLIASKQRTAQLSEQLLIAQEQERARISRELHDGVGQRINTIKFALDNIVGRFVEEGGTAAPTFGQLLGELGGALRETVEEVRRVSMALRPSILDDLGIVATLTWFMREFRRAMPGIEIDSDVNLEESGMDPLLKTELFRITQEAFNNIARHSGAGRVELSLIETAGQLVLRIKDDGRGLIGMGEQAHGGVGLQSMQERAELTGGELFVISRDGRGTTIVGRWRSG